MTWLDNLIILYTGPIECICIMCKILRCVRDEDSLKSWEFDISRIQFCLVI